MSQGQKVDSETSCSVLIKHFECTHKAHPVHLDLHVSLSSLPLLRFVPLNPLLSIKEAPARPPPSPFHRSSVPRLAYSAHISCLSSTSELVPALHLHRIADFFFLSPKWSRLQESRCTVMNSLSFNHDSFIPTQFLVKVGHGCHTSRPHRTHTLTDAHKHTHNAPSDHSHLNSLFLPFCLQHALNDKLTAQNLFSHDTVNFQRTPQASLTWIDEGGR